VENILGLDDNIPMYAVSNSVMAPSTVCDGNTATANYLVTDPTNTIHGISGKKHKWWFILLTDITTGAISCHTASTFTLPFSFGIVNLKINEWL
jgi:hypothetical protein